MGGVLVVRLDRGARPGERGTLLKAAARVLREHEPEMGRFGWARHPEGNRIELREPDPQQR